MRLSTPPLSVEGCADCALVPRPVDQASVLVPIGQGRSVHCKGLRSHCEIALGSRISGLGLRLRRLGLAKFLGAGRALVFKCVSSINSALGRSEVSFARLLSNCSSDFIEAITSLLRVRHRQS